MSAQIVRLAVVVVTESFEMISKVVEALRAQTTPEAVEVVIVMPERAAPGVDQARLAAFGAVRIVAVPSIFPMPGARAAGVRAARAPLIFIGETHSFPHPGFAAAIIAAHEGPWDVVVPGLDNANPATARSWASFLLDYGYWHAGLPASRIASGPTWNASYKREILLELDDSLDSALSAGDELPVALRARNRKFYFEPAARIDHANLESRGWLDERFLSGLVVGANRGKRWPLPRRLAYFAASPLIPFVLLYRNVASIGHLYGTNRLPPGSAAVMLVATMVRCVGEAVGYLRGLSRKAESRMDDYELNKLGYIANVALQEP